MTGVLAGEHLREEVERQKEAQDLTDYEERILRVILKRGPQHNISFFAFTATPKYKTLEFFGQRDSDGRPQPFHVYSMRQAIEENFILDVLQNYTTYRVYYRLLKSIQDDPDVEKRKAARALARFISFHPHNITQKTEVMVEHFRRFSKHKMGGKAKAMVVTDSRLHAVRYKQAFDAYIKENGYTDIKTLVAFSGSVSDPDMPDRSYTEAGMNIDHMGRSINERELPERFSSGEYQILLVAEKYQTGFNQPLLHTMYVDKRLDGIQAVQTLSRLNRTAPGKESTFVLDFRNEPEVIRGAFQPYYDRTLVGTQATPGQLYELRVRLDAYQVYYEAEVEGFGRVFYKEQAELTLADHARMNAYLDPAVSRFKELGNEICEEFRKSSAAYVNLYAFMSQILPFQDLELEKRYTFLRFLLGKLPQGEQGPIYDFGNDVALRYYRLTKISEGSIDLDPGAQDVVDGPTGVGTGQTDMVRIELSKLIDILNDRFGTEFKPGDQLFFDSIQEDAIGDDGLRQAAEVNTEENFNYELEEKLGDLFMDRMEQNREIVEKFLNEEKFREFVSSHMLKAIYSKIKDDSKIKDEFQETEQVGEQSATA